MFETLSTYLNQAGPFAPTLYIGFFLATALLPFIPTPLISALGGSLLGFGPAVGYGVLGLGLGAALALTLSRHLGRPVIIRLFGAKTWRDWEQLLGIRSPITWGLIFFLLNIDFAVVAAGLSGLPLWQLWISAMIARLPWLVASAWFGESFLKSDSFLPIILLVLGFSLVLMQLLRRSLRKFLVSRQAKKDDDGKTKVQKQYDL